MGNVETDVTLQNAAELNAYKNIAFMNKALIKGTQGVPSIETLLRYSLW